MRRIEAYPIDRFNESEIEQPAKFEVSLSDGRQLDYEFMTTCTPAVTSSYDAYTDRQLVLTNGDGAEPWDEHVHYPVGRLSSFHGRNLELLADSVMVEDSYGNEFRSLSIKGSDLTDPHLFKSVTASRDFIIHGLQESLVMERVIRASGILRETGVGTEYILGLALPAAFPVGIETTGIDEKRDIRLPELLEHLATEFAQKEENRAGKSPLEVKQDMIERFKDCDYLVSYRAMDTPFRFTDLYGGGFERFTKALAADLNDPDVSEYLESLNPFSYMYHDFAPNLASNIAKMHNAGIYHGFLHSSNITALGSIVDLDSCKGEALGLDDEPITIEKEVVDVETAINSIRAVIGSMHFSDKPYPNLLVKQDLKYHTTFNFLREYTAERELSPAMKMEIFTLLIASEASRLNSSGTGSDTYRTAEVVSAVAQSQPFFDKVDAIKLPRISKRSLRSASYMSFLNTLPAALFMEKLEEWDEEQWKMNDKLEAVGMEETNRPIIHPLRVYAKESILKLVLTKKSGTANERLGNEFISTVLGLMGKAKPGKVSGRDVRRAQQYMDRQLTGMFNELSSPRRLIIPGKLHDILGPALPDYAQYMGQVFPSERGKIKGVNVIYLKSDKEYFDVLEAFGVEDIEDCKILAEDEEYRIISGKIQPAPDTVVFVDYRHVDRAVEQIPKRKALTAIVADHPERKTMFMISGYESDKPTIYFPSTFKTDEDTHIGYQEILRKLAPSYSYAKEPSLFDPAENLDS